MKTAKELTDDLISRMKNTELKKFQIVREVGDNWLPNGSVPFDISAKNGIATFTVWAEFLQDAEDQVSSYLERDEDE